MVRSRALRNTAIYEVSARERARQNGNAAFGSHGTLVNVGLNTANIKYTSVNECKGGRGGVSLSLYIYTYICVHVL